MADFGLTEAIAKAARKGATGAKVLRPAEQQIIAQEAEAAARKAAATAGPAPAAQTRQAARGKRVPETFAERTGRRSEQLVVPETFAERTGRRSEELVVPEAPPAVQAADVTPVDKALPPVSETVSAAPAPPPVDVVSTAERLSKSTLGDFALDETHMPNFDRMSTTDDVKATIASIAEQNKTKIDVARRGTITNDQLSQLAGELDVSQDVVAQVMKRESGGVLNPETILAARQVLVSSAERLKGLADKIVSNSATDMEKLSFARQIQFHNEYQTQFMGARAEAGRSLNAFNIPVGGDATQAARVGELINTMGGDINRVAAAVKAANGVGGITKVVKAGLFIRSLRAGGNYLNRIFVNGILSGPVTHAVNSAGNAIFQAMNAAELGMAARLGRFLPGAEHVQVGEAMANLHGTMGAVKDAYRLAARTVKTGQTLDNVLKYETGNVRTTNILPELDKPYLGRLLNIVDSVIDAPTERGLAAEDEFFKTMAYRADIERQAYLHALDQVRSGAVAREDAAQTVRNFMENPTPEAQQAAEDWARNTAFQTPLGPTGQAIAMALRKVPAFTLIAPFIRTPVNIFKEAAYRSPVALLAPKFWNDVAKGGRARDLALTRFTIGSATATYVAYLASNGDITGAGPQQPDAKQLWEQNGRRPYSIRIRNPFTGNITWHSYARIEPFASIVGATADTVEILSYLGDDVDTLSDEESQAYQAAGAVVAGIMNNTGNKTFMKGISDFVELTNDPTQNIKAYSNQFASQFVPYGAALKAVRNTQDPYLREAWTVIDKIKDGIPGYSKDLPPRRGLFGELREKNSSSLLGTMSPIPESPEKDDRVYNHLNALMEYTRQVPLTMPDKKVDGLRLTAPEYEHLIRLGRMQPVFDSGKVTLKEKIADVMDSTQYTVAQPMMQVEIIKSLQRQADTIARLKLEQEDPKFAERIAVYRAKKDRLRFGQ